MLCALVVAALSSLVSFAAAQDPGVLHIKIALTGSEQKPRPVPRHTLLISDNPTSAPPRAIVTGADGTADVRLRPGNYTVESDQPVVFEGKAYQWTQMVDIVAGRDAVLELTSSNAEVVPLTPATPASATTPEPDLALLARWQDSVVALWTPTAHASGFVIDANGLVVTNERVVGAATSVEVQLTPTVKVAGSVLAVDAARDVAVLRIAPDAAASLRPISLGCSQPATVKRGGQELVTIGAPLRQQKGPAFGSVSRLEAHAIVTDFVLPTGSAGGPVFTADGIVGMTSVDDERADERRQNSRVVIVTDVCDVVRSAEEKMKGAAPPGGAHLPVEPPAPFPEDALKNAAPHDARGLTPYQMSSSDFDITFITPVLIYGAQSSERASRSTGRAGPQGFDASLLVTDFGNWSEYVGDVPPVLLVRVTPKLVEGFWTRVGRGAARTQGVALPPLKHPKSGFSRLRASCGGVEVTPIHPFKLEHRLSGTTAIYEGLYAFEPGALGPSCADVKLTVYSEKEPEKGDTRVVDPKIVQRAWDDFAPYRALKQPS